MGSDLFYRLQVLLALGDYMNVQCHTCIGGTNVGEDIRKLDYGQHVVSGTPGRVFGECTETEPCRIRAGTSSGVTGQGRGLGPQV